MINTKINIYVDEALVSSNHNVVTKLGKLRAFKQAWSNKLSIGSGTLTPNDDIASLGKPLWDVNGTYKLSNNIVLKDNVLKSKSLLSVSKANTEANVIISEVGIGENAALHTYSPTKNGVGDVASITLLNGEILRVDYSIETTVAYRTEDDNGTLYMYGLPSLGTNVTKNITLKYSSDVPEGLMTEADIGTLPQAIKTMSNMSGSLSIADNAWVVSFTEAQASGKVVNTMYLNENGLSFLVVFKQPITLTGSGSYKLALPIPSFENKGV